MLFRFLYIRVNITYVNNKHANNKFNIIQIVILKQFKSYQNGFYSTNILIIRKDILKQFRKNKLFY